MTRNLTLILSLFLPMLANAKPFIVENCKPNAEIIIADDAMRTVRLAAAELQETIQKISGAKLPITTTPGKGIAIYVGESDSTQKLGVTAKGLEHGAYRIRSGKDWLALLGTDTDFEPKEPWGKNNGDVVKNLQRRWEEASGLPYGVTNRGLYFNRRRMPKELAKKENEYFWVYDERGSYNAVCGFLRSLGVRWYAPGPLGEVLPELNSIPLPDIDETTKPDFEFRQFYVRIGAADEEMTRWILRLGMRHEYGFMLAHGMDHMTRPDRLKTEHPDWFALYGGKRDTDTRQKLNHLCYSNEELLQETVKWARALFDVYDFPSVSIMPPDAYGSICQCILCEGKDDEEMGSRGKLSNHVFDFANRVAREVGKTHPDKVITCCAYGANTLPVTNIEKLEPNLQVMIVGGRRPKANLPEQLEYSRKLREGWMKKTDRKLMIFENYPMTHRGVHLPIFIARTIGKTINATRGISRGEDIWTSLPRYHDARAMAFDAFQIYFTTRMWWGGPKADAGAMLKEHCQLYYGPDAGPAMLAFFDYCEGNFQAMEKELEPVETALAMFNKAKSDAPAGTTYAKRIGLIDEFLEKLRAKAVQLAQGRGPVATVRTVWEPREPIVIDGKFDDEYWVRHRKWWVAGLRELQTGDKPVYGTTVMSGWHRGSLYFAIRCEERPGDKLNIGTTKNHEEALFRGDAVEIELATESHSYYQIAVNPAGAICDLDRATGRGWDWSSQAEVATQIADDHWTVEIRIPVTEDDSDPLNFVVGRKPSKSLPWFFNVCRQRIRENGAEYSAISPTGELIFHRPHKFAWFYHGRHHVFDVDETVTDFYIEYRAAAQLRSDGKFAEAQAAFAALADHEKANGYQKSRTMAQAAACARQLKNYPAAAKFTSRIPEQPIAAIARMQNLAAERNWKTILTEFGDTDFTTWPFTEIGPAAFERGKAHYAKKSGDKAETDFQLALDHTTDSLKRLAMLNARASNFEAVLANEDRALELYRKVTASTSHTTNAQFFNAVQGAARILTKQKKFDAAMAIHDLVKRENLSGSWFGTLMTARAETLAASGRAAEALELYRAVFKNESTHPVHRKKAETAIEQLDQQ